MIFYLFIPNSNQVYIYIIFKRIFFQKFLYYHLSIVISNSNKTSYRIRSYQNQSQNCTFRIQDHNFQVNRYILKRKFTRNGTTQNKLRRLIAIIRWIRLHHCLIVVPFKFQNWIA